MPCLCGISIYLRGVAEDLERTYDQKIKPWPLLALFERNSPQDRLKVVRAERRKAYE